MLLDDQPSLSPSFINDLFKTLNVNDTNVKSNDNDSNNKDCKLEEDRSNESKQIS
jgi:hypothetical protein